MEVHHHAHTPRKKWTHYFWEFLMLFLAVFCGFLAEYQLEHVIENQREKKYMSSLVEDLINDTADFNINISSWQKTISHVDSLRGEIEKKPSQRNHLLLYRCAALLNVYNSFVYHDRTIGQLKNAGNFRLIRQKNVADSLVVYDAWIITILKDMEANFSSISLDRRRLQDQLFNSKFFSFRNRPALLDSAAKLEPEVIAIRNEDILFQYYNCLYTLRFQINSQINFQKQLLQKAKNLITQIRTV